MSSGSEIHEPPRRPGRSHGRRARTAGDAQIAAAVGGRLREVRSQAGLSLERLSKLAGVSRGMLSQIELGRSAPTVTILSRIAATFELPVAAFLAPSAAGNARVAVLRLSESQRLQSADGKFVSRALFPFQGTRKAEFYALTLQPGCSHDSAPHGKGTAENLVVAGGRLEVDVESLVYALEAGDSIHFAADVPHSYRNPGSEAATAYLVVS